MKFVVDTMLGNLAKWLRVLGYDTHCQGYYAEGQLSALMREGRRLVTRDSGKKGMSRETVFIHWDRAGEQLMELNSTLRLNPAPRYWFTRCLRCNVLLDAVRDEEAMEKVPEYVFYENHGNIRVCKSCGRYFWPGSHRNRMVRQLDAWGFVRGKGNSGLT